jgi:hypothetical protein
MQPHISQPPRAFFSDLAHIRLVHFSHPLFKMAGQALQTPEESREHQHSGF